MDFELEAFTHAHAWMSSPEAKNEFTIEGDTVWIKLTQGKSTCVDLVDWERVRGYRWHAEKSKKT